MSRRAVVGAFVAALVLSPVGVAVAADGSVERVLQDPAINESSGLAASTLHPGIVWTVNDSGDEPRLYALDDSGATVAVVTLHDVDARDWEALATVRGPDGASVLWIGDIGDNTSSWDSVRLLRIPEPATLESTTVSAESYNVVYEDGPADAEALLADPATGRLYIATKRASNPGLYAVPEILGQDEPSTLTRVGEVPPVVTDGAWNPVDGRFALVGYVYAWIYDSIGSEPERIVLPRRPQGETVTWTTDGSALLVGSEGVGSTIWRVDVGGGIPSGETAAPSESPGASESVATALGPDEESSSTGPAWWLWALGGSAVLVGVVIVARR